MNNQTSSKYIISASKRTDIPAFYAEWFINRVREGYALYRNPFNLKQTVKVSLKNDDVLAFVFWTRNPEPLFKYLDELIENGFKFYFQFTINNYPTEIDASTPKISKTIKLFKYLSEKFGKEFIQWRYDPIIISNHMNPEWHIKNFGFLCKELNDLTERCYFSFVDYYIKTERRIKKLEKNSDWVFYRDNDLVIILNDFLTEINKISLSHFIKLYACNEPTIDKIVFENKLINIYKASCIDLDIVKKLTNIKSNFKLDNCGCFYSKDIGAYDSCMYKCEYCYANVNFDMKSKNRLINHNPKSEFLIDEIIKAEVLQDIDDRFKKAQLELFI